MTKVRSRRALTSLSQLETCTDTTFIIQNTIRAAAGVSEISIASGVSLVFDGGMIAGALTGNTDNPEAALKLVGNFTSVEAPITQIFGDTVTASGYWHIDRAYPQWFDAVAGTQSYYASDPHDCSVAINKAVEMKMSGEVFLPAGVYLVSHTIRLRHGINLIGDSATYTPYYAKNPTTGKIELVTPDSGMVESWGRATYITPFLEIEGSKFTLYQFKKDNVEAEEEDSTVSRPVIVAVNIKDNEPNSISAPAADKGYALPMGSVEHIYFYNYNKDAETDEKAADLCLKKADCVCCLVAGAFSFRDVMWRNFYRAIKWTEEYNDSKTMYRCYVETTFRGKLRDKLVAPTELPYLIDIRGCGDAMVIDDCHIDRGVYEVEKDNQKTEVQLYKAIAMRTCLGGSIRNSIIHGDIDIEHCTALEFADNHCEFGMQMNIRWSQISIHDNFIEKGRVPNFVIHAMDDIWSETNSTYGVVNFSDNKFVCYNNIGNRPFVEKASEFDILLKTRKGVAPYSIDLARNYRVTANSDTVSFHPTGIMLGTQDTDSKGAVGEIQPFTAFNGHSYFLSDHASIRRNLKLKQSHTVSSIPALTITAMNNDNIPKPTHVNNSRCVFSAQVIVDEPRRIAGNSFDVSAYDSEALTYSCNGKPFGILFVLNWDGEETACMLRIIRKTYNNGTLTAHDVVTVPVCGARFLHDNSISVEGHPWMPVNSRNSGFVQKPYNDIEQMQFCDGNLSCRTSVLPTMGTWESGDTIISKVSSDASESGWIGANMLVKE